MFYITSITWHPHCSFFANRLRGGSSSGKNLRSDRSGLERNEGDIFGWSSEMIVKNIVVVATLTPQLPFRRGRVGCWRGFGHFASAVPAMKDAEILKRFLIILRVFCEHVRIKYNKWRAKSCVIRPPMIYTDTQKHFRDQGGEAKELGIAKKGAGGFRVPGPWPLLPDSFGSPALKMFSFWSLYAALVPRPLPSGLPFWNLYTDKVKLIIFD